MSNDKLNIDDLLAESAKVAAEFDAAENKVEHWESNQADLQDRQALRRVSGLSTELQDISDAATMTAASMPSVSAPMQILPACA